MLRMAESYRKKISQQLIKVTRRDQASVVQSATTESDPLHRLKGFIALAAALKENTVLQSCSGTFRSERGREGSAVRALRRVDTSCIAVRCKLSSASEHRWKRPNCWSSTLSGTESGYLFPRLQTLSRSMSARVRAIVSNSIPLKSVRVKNMPDVYEIAGNCRTESCRTSSSGNLERHTSTRILLAKTKRRIARSLGAVCLTISPCH